MKGAPLRDLLEAVRPPLGDHAALQAIVDLLLDQEHPAGPALVRALADHDLTCLGFETFACPNDIEGERRFEVAVFRFEPFGRALSLQPGDRDVMTELVLVPPLDGRAEYERGAPEEEPGSDYDERPVGPVEIRPLLVARTAISQALWDSEVGGPDARPARHREFEGPRLPIDSVNADDAQAFGEALGLRLPTEAEWEFFCRGGTSTPYCFGSRIETEQVNFDGRFPHEGAPGEFRATTVAVGSLPSNAFGLHEVHGNVQEWCQDSAHHPYQDAPNDGSAIRLPGSEDQAFRGGSWRSDDVDCRSAARGGNPSSAQYPHVGFRLVRDLPD